MFYTRGGTEEWDRIATVTGDDGWSWKSILPLALKVNNLSSIWENMPSPPTRDTPVERKICAPDGWSGRLERLRP